MKRPRQAREQRYGLRQRGSKQPYGFWRFQWSGKLPFPVRFLLGTTHAGLTLVETMVSLVVMTTLLSVVLQLIVSASWMAMQAEKYNQAMYWIQADVEAVRFRAREFEKNAFPFSSYCTTTGGVAAGLLADINSLTNPPTSAGATVVTLGPKLLGGENLLMTRTVNITSNPNNSTNNPNPNKLLQLTYTVNKADTSNSPVGNPIASFTTEVVPYAALKCP